MFSKVTWGSVRPSKRQRDEIDDKIDNLSKIINSDTKKSFLLAKLNNIKLKQQKLNVLYHSLSESSKQSLLNEIDIVISENEIDIEIDSMRSSKKFKNIENKYREKLSRDRHDKENRVFNSTPKESSTSYHKNFAKTIKNVQELDTSTSSTDISRKNLSNNLSNNYKCDKSVNTDPVYILDTKGSTLSANESMYSTVESINIVEESISPVGTLSLSRKSLPPKEKKSTGKSVSLRRENVTPKENNESAIKENSLQSENNELGSIQSKWFENSFEMEHYVNRNADVSPKQLEISVKDKSSSNITDNNNKCRINQPNIKKSHEIKASTLMPSIEMVTEQPVTVNSTTNSNMNQSENESEKATYMVLPKATTLEFPKTRALLKGGTKYSKDPETLPDAVSVDWPVEKTTTLSETSRSHEHIVNLYRSYKQICFSEQVKRKWGLSKHVQSIQSGRNNNYDKNFLEITNDFKMAVKNDTNTAKKTISTENLQHCAKAAVEDVEDRKQKKGNKDRITKVKQTNNSKSNFRDSFTISQNVSNSTSLNISTKYKDLFTKSLHLPTKSKGSSTKFENVVNKFQNASGKSEDSLIKSKNFSTKRQNTSKTEKSKETIKKATAVQTISQEDLVNDLIKDSMASKRSVASTSTMKTASCRECGLVYDGHMCAFTIKKILEQC